MSDEGQRGGLAVFRHRDYRNYISSRFLWGMGLQIQTVAIAWIVYDLTRDPLALGFIGLATFVPTVPLSLVTGPVADRYDRRMIMAICCSIMALCATSFIVLLATGILNGRFIWPAYLIVGVLGVVRSFGNPAGQALVMTLVPRDEFQAAAAWNNTTNQTANIIGPSIGGLLFPFGVYAPFIAALVVFLIAVIQALMIAPRPATAGRQPVTWSMLLAGYRFIWATPVILGTITLDLAAVLMAGATALLPIFARDIFHTGPWGLGLLRAMPSVGAIVAALVLANFPLRRNVGRTMFVAVIIYGLATVSFALCSHIVPAMFCLVVIGAADVVSVLIRQTLIQVETPDEMRGRVIAVHTILTGASNQLGDFESGALAWLVGAVPAVILGGTGAVAASLLWMRLFPALRDRQRFDAS